MIKSQEFESDIIPNALDLCVVSVTAFHIRIAKHRKTIVSTALGSNTKRILLCKGRRYNFSAEIEILFDILRADRKSQAGHFSIKIKV